MSTVRVEEWTVHDRHCVNRLERGAPLTDAEISCYLADHQTSLRHGTAEVGTEIAEDLRDRLARLLDLMERIQADLAAAQ